MNDTSLGRHLKRLHRTVIMLQTELRQEHLDVDLIAEIEQQMEHGIGTDPRTTMLARHVDALRESTLTPRPELFRDAARACEQLKDAIAEIVDRLA